MRIFVAGASGVMGRHLLPLLVADGHEVAGMTRSPEKADTLRALGAMSIVCDVFDATALRDAVVEFGAEAVIHQLTDLPDDVSRIPEFSEVNFRVRREGTRNLIDAAEAAGAERFLAQSIAWELSGEGGRSIEDLERAVLDVGGVVLRYGQWYGPGTYHEGKVPPHPRIQVEEAARRTVAFLDAPSGVITVTEDG